MSTVDAVPRPQPAKPRRRRAPEAARVLDAAAVALLTVDADLQILSANAAADMLGASPQGLANRPLAEVLGPDSPALALIQAALVRGSAARASEVALHVDGRALGPVELAAAPLDDRSAVTLAILPRSQGESALSPRAAPALARTLAHEVRNPLAGIRAAAQLLGRGGDAASQDLCRLIVDEVDRIRRLTDRIDALESLPPPRMGPVNVHEALGRVRVIIGQGFPDLAIAERYDPSLPPVSGDLDQLIQAILNIAKNGAEAAQARAVAGGPPPALTLASAFRPGLKVRSAPAVRPRAQLEIAIEDNGPGLPAAIQARPLEPFVSTKRGGMGLGLAITAEIIARHDGRIEFERAGALTRVRLLLPVHRPEG